MKYVETTYEITISDGITTTTKASNKSDYIDAYEEVRSQVCIEESISASEFEIKYSVDNKRKIQRFINKPWSRLDDLEEDLENVNGISKVISIPDIRVNKPPTYYAPTDLSFEKIKSNIKDYYNPLVVENADNGVYIEISPSKYLDS